MKRKTIGKSARIAAIVSMLILIFFAGLYYTDSFDLMDPMCTYRYKARISTVVEYNDKLFSSALIKKARQSRAWISGLNSAGCKEKYGTALAFRLPGDEVLLVPSGMCRKAEQALIAQGEIDILDACNGTHRSDGVGFLVNSAEKPEMWRPLSPDDPIKIIKMTAKSTWLAPNDDLEDVVPKILKSRFDTGGNWWRSPERILSFGRRYYPSKSFTYRVNKQEFTLR